MHDSNFTCFSCGWSWHVAPRNQSKLKWRVCPACGSDDTAADDEPIKAETEAKS